MKTFEKIFQISGLFAGVIIFAIAIMIFLDVILSLLFSSASLGIYEITQVGFLIAMFMALGITHFNERDIRINLLQSKFKKGVIYNLLEIFNSFVVLIFFIIIINAGLTEWLKAYDGNYVRSGIIRIPSTVHLSFLLIGSVLMCLSLILSIFKNVRGIIYRNS